MNPIIYAIPIFILTIMIEAGVAWWRGLRVYNLADALTSLQFGVLSQVSGLFLKLLSLGIYSFVYAHAALWHWPNTLLAWGVALLMYDFCYYWNHRLNHEVGVLWASHVVHHSSEYYNLTTALRQTSTGSLLSWLFYLPMALLGVSPLMFVCVALIDLLYQYWVHTELIGKLGWFDRVFVSPSNHRVHHGQNDYCIDRNYGGVLIIWDRLFGSFVEEREGEVIAYGIRKPLHSFNPIWGNLHHYAELWQGMHHERTWRGKLGVLIAPPGGWRDGPVEHLDTSTLVRYASPASRNVLLLVLIGYLGLNVALVYLLLNIQHMSATQAGLIGITIAFVAAALGSALMWPPRAPQRAHH